MPPDSRRTPRALAALLATGLLALSACGGESDERAPQPATQPAVA